MLDTSVAVKFHIPEEHHTQARVLRSALEEGRVEMHAPATILAEAFNALWQQHRRSAMPLETVRDIWGQFVTDPITLYASEDLMPRAAEIAFASGVIVYDALFLALAEETGTVMVSNDGRLLKALERTTYARLAHPLVNVKSLL